MKKVVGIWVMGLYFLSGKREKELRGLGKNVWFHCEYVLIKRRLFRRNEFEQQKLPIN